MSIILKIENIGKIKRSTFISSKLNKSKKKEQKYRCFEVYTMLKTPLKSAPFPQLVAAKDPDTVEITSLVK